MIDDGRAHPLADAVRHTAGQNVGGERIPPTRIEQSWRVLARRDAEGV